MPRLKEEEKLFVRSMGKMLQVTAMFTDDASANAFMEKNLDDSVVAEFGGVILLAKHWDNGEAASGAPEMAAALRAILFQVVQGKVLERDSCITQAREALRKAGALYA